MISRILPLAAGAFLAAATLTAQTDAPDRAAEPQAMLTPGNTSLTMEGHEYDGVAVMLDAKPKEVRHALENWAGDQYDIDFDYKGGVIGRLRGSEESEYLVAEDVTVPEIGEKAVTLRARVTPNGAGSELVMFASYGDDLAIGPDGEYGTEFEGVEKLTDNFLSDFVPEYYREQVAGERNEVEDVQKDLDRFKKKMADNKDEIEKLERENVELESNIASAETKLEAEKGALEEVKEEMEEATDKVDDNR